MNSSTEQPESLLGSGTGRLPTGQFAPGNRLSVGNQGGSGGNPVHRRMKALQGAIVRSVTAGQVQRVMNKMYEMAVAGDVAAARVFLDRSCGRAALEKRFEVEVRAKQTVFIFPCDPAADRFKRVENSAPRLPQGSLCSSGRPPRGSHGATRVRGAPHGQRTGQVVGLAGWRP